MEITNTKTEKLAIAEVKAFAAKKGLTITDEAAKAVLDEIVAKVERKIMNGSSSATPVGLLPDERECCGTFPRTPHRSTCAQYRGKFKPSN